MVWLQCSNKILNKIFQKQLLEYTLAQECNSQRYIKKAIKMKNLIIVICLLLSVSTWAQREQTLFGKANSFGLFVSPLVEFSQTYGDMSTSGGGGAGLIINNFFLGAYGLGSTDFVDFVDQDIYRLEIAHGGLWLGYAHRSRRLIHPYSSLKIGWGAVNVDFEDDFNIDDAVFVLTPEVGLELNVFRFCRVAVTGGYRIVDGISKSSSVNESEFNSFTGGITFRFGFFGHKKNRNKYRGDIDIDIDIDKD